MTTDGEKRGDAAQAGQGAGPGRRRTFPLRVHIATLFILLLGVAGLALVGYGYATLSRFLLAAGDEAFLQVAERTTGQVRDLLAPARLLLGLSTRLPLAGAATLRARLDAVPFLAAGLTGSRQLAAIFVGYPDGAFFLLRPLPDGEARSRFGAAPDAAFLAQSIEVIGGRPEGRFLDLDARGSVLRDRRRPDYRFDPRTRDWYQLARGEPGLVRTPPYVFFTTREVGVTLARRAEAGGIVGVDITLQELSRRLAAYRPTPSSQLALVGPRGELVAHPESRRLVRVEPGSEARLTRLTETGDQALREVLARTAVPGSHVEVEAQDRTWLGLARPVDPGTGEPLTLLVATPRDELLAQARSLAQGQVLIGLLLLAAAAPLVWLTARGVSRPLEVLARDARAIHTFDFRDPPPLASRIVEVADLGEAMAGMRGTVRQFLETSAALAAEERLDRLLERVLADTVRTSEAEAGALYLLDDPEAGLSRAVGRGVPPEEPDSAFPPVLDRSGAHACARAGRDRKPVAELVGGRPVLTTLAVPLVSRTAELVGVLGLQLRGDLTLRPGGRPDPRLAFAEALSSSAAVAIETRHLIQAQRDLLEALIRLVAAAIDAKSPYTGGHCQRVPVIARLLAEAASAQTEGPLERFTLSEAEQETLHIAAWLHDCGKVTTPEYVVDKATKLETIRNRIHEIRMRFEVLKRDAEVAYWKAVAAGADEADQRTIRDRAWQALDEDFAFVAECNIGGELMSPDRVSRLERIGSRIWTRTLDDRLGLSEEERRRRTAVPPAPPPTEEPLLADRSEDVVARPPGDRWPPGNRWGFRLDVPEHRLNLGELHNLRIGRGTLTAEERYLINDHIVQTVLMLSALPFPKHLRAVPDVAGGHHERMDGQGYPRRLRGPEISILARILAIADVFEALTASDRPYKKAKPLSEALSIMRDMARGHHIDPDLFRVFIRSGVYRRYADEFLADGQRDPVDEGALLAS